MELGTPKSATDSDINRPTYIRILLIEASDNSLRVYPKVYIKLDQSEILNQIYLQVETPTLPPPFLSAPPSTKAENILLSCSLRRSEARHQVWATVRVCSSCQWLGAFGKSGSWSMAIQYRKWVGKVKIESFMKIAASKKDYFVN